ncbi:MAG TPA: efflux RND transporter periplasmic adaptor subunit [Phycisphaerae bacterium]|nr:efflux RND transporter periplasmic adaptor subunit [Phycisphaerae bacterium]
MSSHQSEAAPAAGLWSWPRARRILASRRLRRRLAIGGIALVALVVLGVAFTRAVRPGIQGDISIYEVRPISFPVTLKEKGEVKAKKSVDVKCKVDGRSTIIWLIPEGTTVKEGDLLVELASEDIDETIEQQRIEVERLKADVGAAQSGYEIQLDENKSKIRKAELKLKLAKLELEKYLKGDYQKDLREANLGRDQAEYALKRAEEDYGTSRKLHAQHYITNATLEDDAFAEYKAKIELEKAELALDILETYTHEAAREQKKSDMTEAEKELERTGKEAAAQEAQKKAALESKRNQLELVTGRLEERQEQKANCKIHAPAPGLVVYASLEWWRNTRIEEGAEVHERQTIIELPDPSVMQVLVKVHESKKDKIKLGQRAAVTVEGVPDETFTGVVTQIAPLADQGHRWLNPDLKQYRTEITLDKPDERLTPNATAEAEIVVDYMDDVLAVPIQAVYGFGGEQYVFVRDGSDTVPSKVKLGASSTEYAEVLEGVRPGQRIMMTISDEVKQMLVDTTESENQQNHQITKNESLLRSLATSRPTTTQAGATQPGEREEQPTTRATTRSTTQPAPREAQSQPTSQTHDQGTTGDATTDSASQD